MKKELMVLLMIVSSAMILSAEGKQDEDTQLYGRGQGPGMMGGNSRDARSYDSTDQEEWFEQREAARDEFLADLDVITVSGALTLVNGELPFIESDSTKVYIMAPWYDLGELKLENGMEVSVEGYEMPRRPLQWDDSEKSIMVTKAVINGEEIVVEHPMDGNRMMGGFGGRGGAPGKGGFGGHGNFQGGGMMGRRS
jgi:hypothetical protein